MPILMDNVHCIGNETKLTDCPYETHTADCSHQLDSGVKCFPKGNNFMHSNCLEYVHGCMYTCII